MADKGLPNRGILSADNSEAAARVAERRAFLRRAALTGLPVMLASVRARTAWGQTHQSASCAGSLRTSGCGEERDNTHESGNTGERSHR